ncbi:MAG: DUF4912 domain-containing protein [Treponema sp.]|jgi:hypothetical protein|nr:DUF4912 domain-containing protein [Treponema sp.]
MNEARLTKPYLESLSTSELTILADRFCIDIPSVPERVFLIEELLEYAQSEDSQVHENEIKSGNETGRREFRGPVALPKHYNISFIEVLIRDPLWAFVFWELRAHDRDIHEKATDFEGYCLRTVPLHEGGTQGGTPEAGAPFTVPVGADDSAWYLNFPPAEGVYKVELCALRNSGEIALITSRPFRMPKLADVQAADQKPLVRLSGIHDFSLIRSVDRLSRTRGA